MSRKDHQWKSEPRKRWYLKNRLVVLAREKERKRKALSWRCLDCKAKFVFARMAVAHKELLKHRIEQVSTMETAKIIN